MLQSADANMVPGLVTFIDAVTSWFVKTHPLFGPSIDSP